MINSKFVIVEIKNIGFIGRNIYKDNYLENDKNFKSGLKNLFN